ncbi:MAG: calcium-binding protein, partial [Paracoccus sp. (in: a-proteobacteria)]|uniref:calcium-binding protein n=1 Tax=Paracoccus sp. TaxID=267 RepID=UPI0026DFE62C
KIKPADSRYKRGNKGGQVIQGAGIIDVSTIGEHVEPGGDLGQIWGNSGNDTIKGFNSDNFRDTITGNAGNDLIDGMAGDDLLYGGSGNNTLIGGKGDDKLRGDAGDDRLIGGTGSDQFIFLYSANNGTDQIVDFEIGIDKILIANTKIEVGFSDLLISDGEAGAEIIIGDMTHVQVLGVSADQLSASDFLFDINLMSAARRNRPTCRPVWQPAAAIRPGSGP